eukprot:1182793-Prorocentrum_minimum.AAC.1
MALRIEAATSRTSTTAMYEYGTPVAYLPSVNSLMKLTLSLSRRAERGGPITNPGLITTTSSSNCGMKIQAV